MKLIKKASSKYIKNDWIYYGIFLCPFCLQEVERQMSAGKKQKSCGCNRKYSIHGYRHTKLYRVWDGILQRCLNPNHKFYQDYGGRGITICNEWLEFIPFRDWSLDNGYQKDLEIDRIDNEGNYEPTNCRFVTHKINSQNRRTTKLNQEKVKEIRIKYDSGYYAQKQLAEEYNVDQTTISDIINKKIWKD